MAKIVKIQEAILHLQGKVPTSPYIQKDLMHALQKCVYSISGGKAWINYITDDGFKVICFSDHTFKRTIKDFKYPFFTKELHEYLVKISKNKI